MLWVGGVGFLSKIVRLRAVSFFLVRRVKRPKHANDRPRDWRRETGEAPPSFLASRDFAAQRSRACTPLTKSEEKERLFAVLKL